MIADDFPHDLEKDKTDPNNKRESNIRHGGGGGTRLLLSICQFLLRQIPSIPCSKCIHDSHVVINNLVTADFSAQYS